MKKFCSVFLMAVSIFSGCSSQSVFDVSVLEEGKEYYMGKEVVSCSDESGKSILNFEEQSGDFFVFFLHLENTSNDSYEIHPEQIFMEVNDLVREEEGKKKVVYNYAVDPERELEWIEEDIEERETEQVVATTTNCLFGLFSVVHDISNDEDEDDIGFEWAGNLVADRVDYEMDMDELMASKEFWQNEVLRITTLHPGDKIGGLVFLPIVQSANNFSLIIPFDFTDHIYNFWQKKI